MNKESLRQILGELYYKRRWGYAKLSDPKWESILDDYIESILEIMREGI